ncbi:MAG TPA: restriction endonuclease, partial [Burkholderiales bacterium]|nr:restriction endonuclease [Burkholderiales bacterium]
MPPRNLLVAIALGALATLAHPFVFFRRFVGSRYSFARSELDTGRWTPELLKRLEWRRFEELCAAYFEALGFRTDLAGAGADGSAAINLYEQGSGSASILVQCRPWNAHRVGIKPVRELRRAMTSGNVGEGVLVTSGKFTLEARDFADAQRISLIDGDELLGKITAL